MHWIWRVSLCLGLISIVVWQRASIARMDERYRALQARQAETDRLVQLIPDAFRIALERHRNKLIAYMESRDD